MTLEALFKVLTCPEALLVFSREAIPTHGGAAMSLAP